MNIHEQKDYIHSHLHLLNKNTHSYFKNGRTIGTDVQSGQKLYESIFKKELHKRKDEIEAGNFISNNEVKKISSEWK